MTVERISVPDIEGEPHARVFAEEPRTVRLRLDAGESVPGHRHSGEDVLLYVVEGRVTLSVGEERHELVNG